jgi:hypothetical protein
MRLAVIYAVLIVSVLNAAGLNPAGEEDEMPSGIPWIAHFEYGGFSLLQAPGASSGTDGYQIRMVHGITAQPWRRLWVYGGWRYRETLAPGFSSPFREPAGLQSSVTYEMIPDLIYGWVGANWPLLHAEASLADSSAWDAFVSGHAVLPDPSLIDPASIQGGGMIRIQTQPTSYMAALSFQQPASFTGLGDQTFRPPWILRASLQCDMPLALGKQRLNFSGTLFGYEKTQDGRLAHAESPVLALRYSAAGLGTEGLWAAALGVTAKLRDANRRIMLAVKPVLTDENDNFQRLHFDVARRFKAPFLGMAWSVTDRSEAFWNPASVTLLVENALDIRFGRRVFRAHGLDARVTALAGSDLTTIYYGVGCQIVFTFRHLGLDDAFKAGASP